MPHAVSAAGGALIDIGESMKRLAEVKDSLDIDVKQNFIDPLQAIAEKDIKDIQVESKTWCASARADLALTNQLHSVGKQNFTLQIQNSRFICKCWNHSNGKAHFFKQF